MVIFHSLTLFPSTHSASTSLYSLSTKIPFPCYFPSFQYPLYYFPSDHLNTPYPSFLSSTYYPKILYINYTSITFSIWPIKITLSMHFIVLPLSFISSTISPNIFSRTYKRYFINKNTLNIIIFKISFICRTITPFKFTFSIFFTIYITSNILCSIRPHFSSFTMLLIF